MYYQLGHIRSNLVTLMKRPDTRLDFQRLEAACQRQGIPTTIQRRVIYKALIEREDHPTVDQIYAAVKEQLPGISRTTVYRTLEKLAELGLARRTHHFAASARFDGNMEQHHHLVCTSCGKVSDFANRELPVQGPADIRCNGFTVADYSIYFEGLCAGCRKSAALHNKHLEMTRAAAKKPGPRGIGRDE